MRKFNKINRIRHLAAALLIAVVPGCSEYLQNPLTDKETGEEINLFIVDFNFFKTNLSVKLLDASDGTLISSPATVKFEGKNGNDIVTYAGEKKPEFYTSQGLLDLTVDPNVEISANSPLEFSILAECGGYNAVTKGVQIQSEGNKTIEIYLSKIENEQETEYSGNIEFGNNDTVFHFLVPPQGLKSAAVEDNPVTVNYSVSISELLKFTDTKGQPIFSSSAQVLKEYLNDPANFIKITISSFSGYQPEIDLVQYNGSVRSMMFRKFETGKLKRLVIANREVGNLNGGKINSICRYTGENAPEIFGFARFYGEFWKIEGTEAVYSELHFSYTVAGASDEVLCPLGSSITFQSELVSSFSLDADVFDAETGDYIQPVHFKGKFPETLTVEYVPERAVKVVFRNNNPAFKPVPPIEIPNFCTGNYKVKVEPADGYVGYRVVIRAMCQNNPSVAIAPSYTVEYRLKESDHPWQAAHMAGGIVDLPGIPDSDYEFRLLWENEWEYSSYSTRFDAAGNYLGKQEEGATVKSKKLEDGRIQISIEKIFDQDICNTLGW